MRRRRTPRPGVTAAATTAVFATGDRPGLTAEATTAVFATGWPMTPTRPTRAALSGISVSFRRRAHEIGLDRGDDGLERDPSVGDELASRASRGGCEWRGPEVLVDEHTGGAAGFHRGGEMDDVDHLAAAMEPGSTAGVLIWENLWAAPFASAARRSGGQLIANGRIPIQAIIASIEADEATASEGD